MNLTDKAKEKLKNAAGGVGGPESDDDQAGLERPDEAQFEPEHVRRGKKPKDDLPQPDDFRREAG